MLKRNIFALIIILAISPRVIVWGQSNDVVINSFRIRTAEKSTDEFIELYNNSENTINLNGWRLVKKTATGSVNNLVIDFKEIVIAGQSSIIVSHRDYSGSKDLTYTATTYSLSDDNSIVLYSDAGKKEVDTVGYGKSQLFEKNPIPNPAADEIWERKLQGVDTDDNFQDFQLRRVITDEADPESTLAVDTNYQIFITEIMPIVSVSTRGLIPGNDETPGTSESPLFVC